VAASRKYKMQGIMYACYYSFMSLKLFLLYNRFVVIWILYIYGLVCNNMAAVAVPDPVERCSAVVLQALENMKRDFRMELFRRFDELMRTRGETPEREGRALDLFHLRRALGRMLNAHLTRILGLGDTYRLSNDERDAIKKEFVDFKDAWIAAGRRPVDDQIFIQNLFRGRINNFMLAVFVNVATDATRGRCLVCDEMANLIFPCGHVCMCQICLNQMHVYGRLCPFCRAAISGHQVLTDEIRRIVLAGGLAYTDIPTPPPRPGQVIQQHPPRQIIMNADAKRSFCVMGDVKIPGLC